MDVGNDLALFVGGDVVDFVADVHVPVDPLRGASGGIASASFDQQANLAHGVLLVIGEVGEDFHLATVEFFGPVALLAGILRRAQVVNWSWDGTREGVERRRENLARAGKLRFHEPGRARPYMAIHTGHAGMRGEGIRRIFWAHHGVTQLAAKSHRLSELVGFVAACGTHDDEHDQEGHEGDDRAALCAIIQIYDRVKLGASDLFSAFDQDADQDQQQSQNQEGWRDHVRKNADVRAGLGGNLIDQEKDEDVGQADDSQRHTREADWVAQ